MAADGLRSVLAATSAPTIVHCCAPEVPFSCITGSGATAVSFDALSLRRGGEDAVGEAVESGLGMFAGVISTGAGESRAALNDTAVISANRASPDTGQVEDAAVAAAGRAIALWRRIGLALGAMCEQIVLTPACGLAGVTPARARLVLARCRAAARLIPELIEEGAQ